MCKGERFIMNVSSVEGMFYHKKTTKHPHTNMAKVRKIQRKFNFKGEYEYDD